jgi:5'-nucleotidase
MLQDPRLPKLLESLRASGRKLFLATNSLWDYTHVVMNFLISGRTGHDRNFDWLEYFDVVITGLPTFPQPSHRAAAPCALTHITMAALHIIVAAAELHH